ncbi:hypothetical protein PRIPAC_73088 [Pristionchus pacificus]|nr:hypothetical protein PRIPAC_73088 [Pristionchus pacificus]
MIDFRRAERMEKLERLRDQALALDGPMKHVVGLSLDFMITTAKNSETNFENQQKSLASFTKASEIVAEGIATLREFIDGILCDFCGAYLATAKLFKAHLLEAHNIDCYAEQDEKEGQDTEVKETTVAAAAAPAADAAPLNSVSAMKEGGEGDNNGGREARCDICQDLFEERDSFKKHLKSAHVDAVQCDLCGAYVVNVDVFVDHLMDAHNIDPHAVQCDICEEYFEDREQFAEHLMEEHDIDASLVFIAEADAGVEEVGDVSGLTDAAAATPAASAAAAAAPASSELDEKEGNDGEGGKKNENEKSSEDDEQVKIDDDIQENDENTVEKGNEQEWDGHIIFHA